MVESVEHELITQLKQWRDINVVKYKKIIININTKMDCRICYSKNLYTLCFLQELLGDKCKVYTEIGTLFGASMCMLMNISKYPTTYVGIDFFDRYYGSEKDPMTNRQPSTEIVEGNITKFNKNHNKYHLVKGGSYDPETIDKFANLNLMIDLFFIDGDHSREGVIKDFMAYHKYVNPGGFIVFDNYDDPKWLGVTKAVNEIKFEQYGFERIGQLYTGYTVRKL